MKDTARTVRVLPDTHAGAKHKWWVFLAISIGTFLTVVDHGSVMVALPNMEGHFASDLPTVQWVIVGYALAISVLLLPMGRLGDMFGRKRVYIGGFAIFVLSAVLAGVSPSLHLLIGAKVLQGVGSAMVQGNGMATIVSTFSGSERGKALGSHLSVVGTGAIAGPALGGLLVSSLGWRWVFFINVPLGLIGIAVAALVLAGGRPGQEGQPGERQTFDWLGAALSGGVLLVFLLVVGNGDRLGWTSAAVLVGGAAAGLLLAAFIWWELRVPSPLLDLRLFRRKLLVLGITAGWISFLGTGAVRFMMPFYLQRVLEYGPREVGLLLMPAALCMVVFGPVSGRLSDKFGWRRFTVGGMALSAAASFVLATWLTESTPVVLVVLTLALQSTGTGLFISPNNSSVMSAVERSRFGVISALTQLTRNSANVTSIAMATTIVVVTMGARGVEPSLDAVSPEVADAFVAGLRRAFLVMGLLLAVGVGICVARGERSREGRVDLSPGEAPETADAAARQPSSHRGHM